MDCADEVAALRRVLVPLSGVHEVKVNLMGGSVTLIHEPALDLRTVLDAIATTGMKGALDGSEEEATELAARQRWERRAVVLSGIALGVGLLIQTAQPLWADIAYAIAILVGGSLIAPKAWRAIRHRSLDMNVLMSVAVIGALAIHQWSEAAAVTFLFALAEMLEAFSLTRARRAVQALMQLAPATAWLRTADGSMREVPVAEVPVGGLILVKSGSRIPLDGEVAGGSSSVDQSPITGESMPVDKTMGDTVFAGTINGVGSLEIITTKAAEETTLSRIIHLVEEAQEQKAPTQRFVDRFAQLYTPLVMVAALLVSLLPPLLFGGAWGDWFYRGLVLLVIACPCALVISTPVSIVSGLTAMARRGVLIKGGAALEAVGRLTALAVDKTGTITEGKPKVTRVIALHGYNELEIVRIAAAIDTHSPHPLAQAVVHYAQSHGVEVPASYGYRSVHGRGAEAEVDGHPYFVGNHRFTHEMAVCSPAVEAQLEMLEAEALSVVIVGHRTHEGCSLEQGEVLGILAVGDAIRPQAREAIAALHRAGLRKVVMLSGDNQRTVDAIAAKAGIDEAMGDLLPEQKIEQIQTLSASGYTIGMVGDGVNDAPAMAAAHVGIAMGKGTDTALEAAEMALMQEDLTKVAEAIDLGRRTVRIIQTNIAFSLAIKIVFLVLALFGMASLWMAITADTGATLLVIANALRLLKLPQAH